MQSVTTGFGSKHSLKDHPNESYPTVNWQDIIAMVKNPQQVDKEKAQWMIPSSYNAYDARRHLSQQNHGEFHYLNIDIDEGDLTLEAVQIALYYGVFNACYHPCAIYSTRSSKPDNKKWRVHIPLAVPLFGLSYSAVQEIIFEQFAAQGYKCDSTLARCGQLVYLPNRGEYYEQFVVEGDNYFDIRVYSGLAEQARAKVEEYRLRQSRGKDSTSPEHSLISHFNATHDTEELLTHYGYAWDGREYQSPMQRGGSGGFSTMVRPDNSWFSLSHSDAAAGIGQKTNEGTNGDAFDLLCYYAFGNDFDRAYRYLIELSYGIREDHPEVIFRSLENFYDYAGRFEIHYIGGVAFSEEAKNLLAEQYSSSTPEEMDVEDTSQWDTPEFSNFPFKPEFNSPFEYAAAHMPGLVGEIIRTYAPMERRHTLLPIMMGAIAAVSHLTHGKMVADTGFGIVTPALMMTLVGPSGAGKSLSRKILKSAQRLTRVHESKIAAQTEGMLASRQALLEFFNKRSQALTMSLEEYGSLKKSQRGNNHTEGLLSALTEASTAFVDGVEGSYAATKENIRAGCPHPSILTMFNSTIKVYFDGVDPSEVEGGFMGRSLVVPMYEFKPSKKRPSALSEEQLDLTQIREKLCTLASYDTPIAPGDGIWTNDNIGYYYVKYFDTQAQALLKHIDEYYDAIATDLTSTQVEMSTSARANEMVARLAAMIGMGMPEYVTKECVEIAWIIVEGSRKFVVKKVNEESITIQKLNPEAKVKFHIREAFKDAEREYKRKGRKKAEFKRGVVEADGSIFMTQSYLYNKTRYSIGNITNLPQGAYKRVREEMIDEGLMTRQDVLGFKYGKGMLKLNSK